MGGSISGDELLDGSVPAVKFKIPLDLPTSQLQEGGEFIKRDGSIALTGDLPSGGHKIIGSPDASNPTDLVTKQQMEAAIASAIANFIQLADFQFKPMTQVLPDPDRTKWQFFQGPEDGKYIVFRGGGVCFEDNTFQAATPEDYSRNGTVITFNPGKEPDAGQTVYALSIKLQA